ncbi:hypothetical protein KEM48_009523 [Puccinia striiformis f. sp. tritici PST-130]|nr:hypothetical protein KEM48_009523 [Puccinia striiformis f. sp. tritici PST-130]
MDTHPSREFLGSSRLPDCTRREVRIAVPFGTVWVVALFLHNISSPPVSSRLTGSYGDRPSEPAQTATQPVDQTGTILRLMPRRVAGPDSFLHHQAVHGSVMFQELLLVHALKRAQLAHPQRAEFGPGSIIKVVPRSHMYTATFRPGIPRISPNNRLEQLKIALPLLIFLFGEQFEMTFRRRKATHHVSDPPMANFFYSALPKIFSLAYLTLLIVELALVEVTICPSVVTPQAAVTHAFAPSPTHLVTEFRHSEEVSSHVAPNDMHVMGMPVLDHNKDPIRFPRVEAEADLGQNVGSPPARPNYQPESSFRKFKNRIKALLQRFKEESIRSYESAKGKIHVSIEIIYDSQIKSSNGWEHGRPAYVAPTPPVKANEAISPPGHGQDSGYSSDSSLSSTTSNRPSSSWGSFASTSPPGTPPRTPPRALAGIDNTLHTLGRTKIVPYVYDLPYGQWAPIEYLPGYLKTQNFIKTDGMCLYRSYAQLILGDQERWLEVQDKIIEYITKNPKDFIEFMEFEGTDSEKLQHYIWKLKNGGWGGHQETHAFAQAYDKNILIVSRSPVSVMTSVHQPVKPKDQQFLAIILEFDHYELLKKDPHAIPTSPARTP